MGVTEFGPLVIQPGLDPMDETTEAGKIVATVYRNLVKEKTGPYRLYYGREVEDSNNFWAFFDFDSVEDHHRFAKERGEHIIKGFEKVFVTGLGFQKHLDNNAFPPTALRSPVTEIGLFYLPPDISDEAKTVALTTMGKFKARGLDKCADVLAVNYGFSVENDLPVPQGKGQKASVLTLLIGWPSIDAHMKFRETQAFQDGMVVLKSLENVLKMAMCHVKCQVVLENEVRKA